MARAAASIGALTLGLCGWLRRCVADRALGGWVDGRQQSGGPHAFMLYARAGLERCSAVS